MCYDTTCMLFSSFSTFSSIPRLPKLLLVALALSVFATVEALLAWLPLIGSKLTAYFLTIASILAMA